MISFKRLDHVFITIPEGKKEEARKFYRDILELTEIPGNHPKGALWFSIADIQLHVREEAGGYFSDRHSAFEVNDLEEAIADLENKNIKISFSSDIEGRKRFFFRDPFDNRFELLEFLR